MASKMCIMFRYGGNPWKEMTGMEEIVSEEIGGRGEKVLLAFKK